MTALVPTDFTARVVWLGAQEVPVKDLVITATPVAEMQLTFAGFGPETHAGLRLALPPGGRCWRGG